MAGRRPSGDGLVRKRKDGRWEGRIMVGRDLEGKPIYRSVVDKSQKEMLEKLHGLIEAYREVELTDRKNYTLGEWLDKWLDDIMAMHLRPSTMNSYRNIIKFRINGQCKHTSSVDVFCYTLYSFSLNIPLFPT